MVKVYIALFSCFGTRAVHLDLVRNLKRGCWEMARVESLVFGIGQEVRGARVKVITKGKPMLINRPVQKLYPLETSQNENGVERENESTEVKEKGVDERSEETKENGGEEGKMKDEVEYS